ncbi:hypothetical protein LIA77_00053 [Sarocladium implicatum]|nr:hypothetical protein LIA77_00053 [Sarocladium implicatum]
MRHCTAVPRSWQRQSALPLLLRGQAAMPATLCGRDGQFHLKDETLQCTAGMQIKTREGVCASWSTDGRQSQGATPLPSERAVNTSTTASSSQHIHRGHRGPHEFSVSF